MDADAPRDLLGCFDALEDPRVQRARLHRLDDIIALAILAVICGAEGWTDVAGFGRAKHDWLKTFLNLPNGIPSHDTLGRVFWALDPDAFERCFRDWVGGLAKTTTQRRHDITSLDHRDRGKDAAYFAQLIRGHWGIENKLHGSLDVTFAEDLCRVRQGHAPQNLARLRRIALNLLKQERTCKRGLAGKRLLAGWNHDYLLKVLGLDN